MKNLSSSECLEYARKNYIPIGSSEDEFLADFATIKYAKKLINKYLDGEDLQAQIIYNHLVLFKNTFKPESRIKIIQSRFNLRQLMVLKPFMLLLKYIDIYDLPEIPLDYEAIEECRKIKNVSSAL